MSKRDDWAKRAEEELRGRPLEDLTWHTLEDIEVKPVYFVKIITENFIPLRR